MDASIAKKYLRQHIELFGDEIYALINDNYMDKSSFTMSLTKNIDPINVSTPFATNLYKWAKFFFKENNKNADSLVIQEIVENYGDSVFNVKNEIDKLCILIDSNDINSDDLS